MEVSITAAPLALVAAPAPVVVVRSAAAHFFEL
jgi:hypothetical protein